MGLRGMNGDTSMAAKPSGAGSARPPIGVAVGAAALGVVAGIAASASRKAMIRAAETLTGDWADLLKADHLVIAEAFDLIAATPSKNVGRKRRLAKRLKAALDKHAFQEENVIYPALKLADPEGPAARLFADHADFKVQLYSLCRSDPGEPTWLPMVQALRRQFEAHAREEEDVIFPELRRLLSAEDQGVLTAAMRRNSIRLA